MKLLLLLLLSSILITDVLGLSCPTGYSLINNQKCQKYFPNRLKHREAEADCAYYGGTLTTVKTAIDNRALATMAANRGASTIWIGVYCFGNQTTSCYSDDNSGALKYSGFAAGYPKIGAGYGGCVYMSTQGTTIGQWISAPCEVAGMPFVCEAPPTVYDSSCTRNYNGVCYFPSTELGISTVNATFSRAQSICRSNNMNLVSIHSQQELNYVKGIYLNQGISQIYLGAQALLPDTFNWVDGSDWNYDYFDPLITTQANCLQMDVSSQRQDSGLWKQVNCQTVNYFLCSRMAGLGMTTTRAPTTVVASDGPKLLKVKKAPVVQKLDLSDFSHCNSTINIAPGTITSFGYPALSRSVTYCSWQIVALGPYRVGLYFTDFSTYNTVKIYDENGLMISQPNGNLSPFKVLGATNVLTVTYSTSMYDASYNYHGFEAVFLPY